MRYKYLDKPAYNPETETIFPDYKIEDGTFISGWKIEQKLDEDGYAPTPDEQPSNAPTLRERIDFLETTTDDIVLMLADIIGGEN